MSTPVDCVLSLALWTLSRCFQEWANLPQLWIYYVSPGPAVFTWLKRKMHSVSFSLCDEFKFGSVVKNLEPNGWTLFILAVESLFIWNNENILFLWKFLCMVLQVCHPTLCFLLCLNHSAFFCLSIFFSYFWHYSCFFVFFLPCMCCCLCFCFHLQPVAIKKSNSGGGWAARGGERGGRGGRQGDRGW